MVKGRYSKLLKKYRITWFDDTHSDYLLSEDHVENFKKIPCVKSVDLK